uniref:Uncharacterized protein n=1 Tax=viral metagenome TaxID=1070528 RepID=A0A6C0KZH7_9ZZZZ|tara:strand:- start:2092 stop:3054 length:963 start_codon:yes stop_codon:yes gene_type:complete
MSKRLSYYWKGDTTNNPRSRFKQINSGSWNITGNVISENESNPPPNVHEHNLENVSDRESEPVVQNKWSRLMNGVWNLFNFTKKSPKSTFESSNDFDLEELEDLSKLRDIDYLEQYEHPVYDDSETPIYDEYEPPVLDEYKNEISIKKTELLNRIDDIVQQNENETRGGTTNRIQLEDKSDKDEFLIPKKDEEYAAIYGDDFVYTQHERDNNEYNPNTGINDLLEIDLLNKWRYGDDNSEAYNTEVLNTHKELVESIGEKNTADLIDFLSETGEDFETNESALEEEEDNEETLDDLRHKASENNRQSRYALRKHKKVKYT